MKNLLFFLVGFALAFFCGLAFAVVPPASLSYMTVAGTAVPWSMDLTGNGDHYYKPPRGDGWERVTADNSFNKSVPYDIRSQSGQLVRVPAPVKIPVDVSRIGKAVGTFAKRVGPLSMGLAMIDLVCDLSQICASSDNLSFNKTTTGTYYSSAVSGQCFLPTTHTSMASLISCIETRFPSMIPLTVFDDTYLVYGGSNYLQYGFNSSGSVTVPASDADWYAAETVLSSAQFIDYLNAAKESIPAGVPVVSPVSVEGASSDVVTHDALGNPTGTVRTQSQFDLIPSPVAQDPFRVQIQETVTTTHINNAGDVTLTSIATVNPEPNEPGDTTIEFDEPTELEVPKAEIPIEYTVQNWGSSAACPSDPVLNVPGGFTITLPVHVVCDAMDMLKPVVLLIASLAAGLIIMGAVKS